MVAAPSSAALPLGESPESSLAYGDQHNPQLLNLLPIDQGIILEIGCASGALGRAYKQLNPNGTYYGIDCDPQAAAIAADRLDRVWVGNAEDPAFLASVAAEIPHGTVACLVYGDTIEHFVDPWSALKRHLDWLSPDGQVLACIPNIQHWTVICSLLRGQWRYSDSGLLDRTHLRFFTEESVRSLFTDLGLHLSSLLTRSQGDDQADVEKFCELAEPLMTYMKLDRADLIHQLQALQYVVRACRPEAVPARSIFLQTLVMEPIACKRVRVSEPNNFLGRLPGVRVHSSDRTASLGLERPHEQAIFIWQRVILDASRGGIERQRKLLERGYLTIVEVDDDPLRWPETEIHQGFTYRACHAIQTSTERLADYLRQLNPYVAVFPNQIAELPPLRSFGNDRPVTIFFGALNREDDWRPLIDGLNRLLIARGDRIQVEVLHDKKFFEALQTPHKRFRPFVPYPDYCETLGQSDVAILPLNPTRFNSMKSDLKFIECAAHGATVLASPVVYGESLIEGVTGLFYRSPAEFENRLAVLLDDRQVRQNLASAAYQWVKENRLLAQHYHRRHEWYLSLLDRREELNEALRRRIPGLFAS